MSSPFSLLWFQWQDPEQATSWWPGMYWRLNPCQSIYCSASFAGNCESPPNLLPIKNLKIEKWRLPLLGGVHKSVRWWWWVVTGQRSIIAGPIHTNKFLNGDGFTFLYIICVMYAQILDADHCTTFNRCTSGQWKFVRTNQIFGLTMAVAEVLNFWRIGTISRRNNQ